MKQKLLFIVSIAKKELSPFSGLGRYIAVFSKLEKNKVAFTFKSYLNTIFVNQENSRDSLVLFKKSEIHQLWIRVVIYILVIIYFSLYISSFCVKQIKAYQV